jgi:uncharacterized protein (TIGR03083 family)
MDAATIHGYGQQTFDAALDAIPEADLSTSGVCGRWSARDVAAHVASYEVVLADLLEGFGQERPVPNLDRFLALGPAFNDEEVERRAGLPVSAVRDELARACARSVAALADIPPELRARPGTIPWYGPEYSLDDLLVYMGYGHKREHAAQLAVFCDRLAA